VVQDGSLLESSCPFITEKLGEMEIESIQPYEMLSALPESARKRFYDMAGFDYDEFAALFDASPKKNLVIIGTSHGSEESARQQRDMSRGSWSSTARGMTSSSSPTPPIPRRPVTRSSSRG